MVRKMRVGDADGFDYCASLPTPGEMKAPDTHFRGLLLMGVRSRT